MKIQITKAVFALLLASALLALGENLPFIASAEISDDGSGQIATISVSITDKIDASRTLLVEWDTREFVFIGLSDNSLEHTFSDGKLVIYLQESACSPILAFLQPRTGESSNSKIDIAFLSPGDSERQPDIEIARKNLAFTRFSNNQPNLPKELALFCSPNPFNAAVRIDWELPGADKVEIEVFDIMGKSVDKVFDGVKEAGKFFSFWDGAYTSGDIASSGIYFIRLRSNDKCCIQKVQLLR